MKSPSGLLPLRLFPAICKVSSLLDFSVLDGILPSNSLSATYKSSKLLPLQMEVAKSREQLSDFYFSMLFSDVNIVYDMMV